MISCVLFDLDGVLVDAREWHYEALNLALVEHGLPPIGRQDHDTVYNGLPTRTKLQRLGLDPAAIISINEAKQRQTMAMVRKHCRRDDRLIHVMRQLKGRGIKLGVCSNAISDTVFAMLELTGLLPYMDLVLGNESVEHNKPNPDIYQKAVYLLGVPLHQTVVVEDSDHGVEAAVAAHLDVLRVDSSKDVTMELFDDLLRC